MSLALANNIALGIGGSGRIWFVNADLVEGTVHKVHESDAEGGKEIE